ncbi:MAG: hypothetical protein MUD10_03675 [Candidatus Pacebacteria bacterium]|jgi:type II secretory pathway pseudopilin PulG|nr:hypothetical protein [Candidatus Paceibacterota bacterium]
MEGNSGICSQCAGNQNAQTVAAAPVQAAPAIPATPAQTNAVKQGTENYSSIFWKFLLLNIATGAAYIGTTMITGNVLMALLVFFALSAALLYWFCRAIGRAMASIGKNGWWPLGLLIFVPFGFWVAYFVARAQLKPRGKWGSDMLILAIVLILAFVAVIGFFAGMVLVSMGGARSKARDARREADMRELASAQEMWHSANGRYYTCSVTSGDCQGAPDNYPKTIGTAESPVDPYIKKYSYRGLDNTADNGLSFCYYAELESGGYLAMSENGSVKLAAPPQTIEDCLGEN